MNSEFAIELVKNLMFQTAAVSFPFLVTAMVIGLGVSLFQAVTSISEQTLSFVPKAVGMLALLLVLLPWLVRTLVEFTTALIERMPEMAR
jgi:flagellar biosynthetic protein FliQ